MIAYSTPKRLPQCLRRCKRMQLGVAWAAHTHKISKTKENSYTRLRNNKLRNSIKLVPRYWSKIELELWVQFSPSWFKSIRKGWRSRAKDRRRRRQWTQASPRQVSSRHPKWVDMRTANKASSQRAAQAKWKQWIQPINPSSKKRIQHNCKTFIKSADQKNSHSRETIRNR